MITEPDDRAVPVDNAGHLVDRHPSDSAADAGTAA